MSGRRRFGAVRRLPSGRWQARYRVPGTASLRTAPKTFKTKTEATRWLATVEADLVRGVWLDPVLGELSFRHIAERWMATKAHLRESSCSYYGWLLGKHILPTFGDRPIGSITTLDVQTWLADRHANSRLGPNSVAKAYRIVRSVMESAVDAGVIARNPCRVKGAATEHSTEMRAATPEEVASIADAAGPRWRALILLAAYSGLRWGELVGLRQKHVDPLHRKLKVEQQLCEVNGRLFFATPKTEAGVRTVALPSFVVDEVVAHVSRFSEPGPEGLVFLSPGGEPLRRENFRKRVWLPALREAGVGHLKFHELRHTGATLAAASGAPLKDIMRRLGHASAAAAIRYQHAVAGHDEAIAEFLDTVARQAATATARVNRGLG